MVLMALGGIPEGAGRENGESGGASPGNAQRRGVALRSQKRSNEKAT